MYLNQLARGKSLALQKWADAFEEKEVVKDYTEGDEEMMDEEGDQKDKTQGKSDLLNIDSIEI